MAFHSLCQKIDVDSLRAKFSHLPSLPAMPQLKLPRSMPKLKTRKIFRSSRENINVNKSATLKTDVQKNSNILQLPPAIPPAQFIDHTPQRISTISSLMYEHEGATYRSANSIEDDYPSPRQYCRSTATPKPISPIRNIDLMSIPEIQHLEENNNNGSIVQRIQKGYKDAMEFRFKHIFSRKTVVRKDSIHVDQYVDNYTQERSHINHYETASAHRERLEDFRFQFKESQQKCGHSYSISSNESISSDRQTNNEQKKNLEIQHRKPGGIAATRFSRVHNPPRRMSEDNDDKENERMPGGGDVEVRQSTLHAIKDYHCSHNTLLEQTTSTEIPLTRGEIYKKRLRRLTKYAISSIDESGVESSTETAKQKVKAIKERKRKAPLTPEQSLENNIDNNEENTFDLIKNNIKRFHRSFKNRQPSVDESDEDVDIEKPKTTSRTDKIAARLRKFKSHNESVDNDEQEKVHEAINSNSPIRTAINKKISQFKKSFKKQTSEVDNRTGDEATPEKHTRTNALIKNLRHIRSKKNTAGISDENHDHKIKSDDSIRNLSKIEQKFEHARKCTLRKVNEKMEKIRFYKKSQENLAQNKNIRSHSSEGEDADDDDDEQINQSNLEEEEHDMAEIASLGQDYATRAIWTTRPILSDHTDNESDSETEYPRVLIHQNTSDLFESTLVISVTRSPKPSSSPTTKITEILPRPIYDEEIAIKEMDKDFKKVPPPRQRRLSEGNVKKKINLSLNKNSNSELSVATIFDDNTASRSQQNVRRASATGLVKVDGSADPWQVGSISKRDEQIYKTKSIDIFERNTEKGGVGAAFEDFDDELKHEPILKISIPTTYSLDMESSEDTDAPDDDNSSRITNIFAASRTNRTVLSNSTITASYEATNNKQKIIFSNSRESLLANSTENVNENTEDDFDYDDKEADRPPSAAPSPPPTPVSITPPPLPERHSSFNEQYHKTPPLPTTKPPILTQEPPQIPERTASMSRISKPLVKTSSLRLAYSEQVNPEDVGKVNKLISRFEQPKCQAPQRTRIIPRKKLHNYSDAYSENEETSSSDEQNYNNNNDNTISHTGKATESPQNIKVLAIRKPFQVNTQSNDNSPNKNNNQESIIIATTTTTKSNLRDDCDFINNMPKKSESFLGFTGQKVTVHLDRNSNSSSSFSCPNSEYGSPLEFPSSLTASPEITPVPDRKRISLKKRRAVARDDDVYLSFDSDEENSYYSISPAGSNRYIVDL